MKYWLTFAILLTLLLVLPLLLIRAEPYDDRAGQALIHDACPAPCFMGIRPGVTSMSAGVYTLDAHAWVDVNTLRFPSQVQQAIFYDAATPRINIDWRWSAALPTWIDETQKGSLTLEDREVKDMTIATHLLLGEIFLTFGQPDDYTFIPSGRPPRPQFQYIAWYADEGMLVRAEGYCPLWHYYAFPVRIDFRPAAPRNSPVVVKGTLCK